MLSKEIVLKKILKITAIISAIAGIFSLTLFIPQIRELIILTGEKYTGRPLTHDIWNLRLMEWGIEFFSLMSVLVLVIYFELSERELNLSGKKIKLISCFFLVIASLMLFIIASESNDIWYDETFSLGLARHSVKDLINLTAKDVHPPLYYIILKLFVMLFPLKAATAKIVSVIPVILVMCITTLFFSKEFSLQHGLLFNLILLSMYPIWEYAVEIRMYSWCLFFCTICCLCSYFILKKGSIKYYLIYILFAELGAYTHYWTAFGLAIHFIILSIVLIKKTIKSLKYIIISAILGIALYLPWVKVVIKQVSDVSQGYWLASISIKTVSEYIMSIIPFYSILKILMIYMLIYMLIKHFKIYKLNNQFSFLAVSFITPFVLIFAATLISIIVKPVFQNKYGLPLCIFLIVFITISFFYIDISKKIKIVFLGSCVFCMIFNSTKLFFSEKTISRNNKVFEQMMNENLTNNTIFAFGNDIHEHIPYCLAYLYPENKIYNCNLMELWTSVYFYNRTNLIDNITNENDICLIINKDDEPPECFMDVPYILANLCNYPEIKFYFIKHK